MKLRSRWLNGMIGFGVARSVRSWMSLCHYEGIVEDPAFDPINGIGGPRIYLVWHEYMLAPIYLRGGCDIAILVSRHRDADPLASIARHSGYECVRGSSYRGGSAALKELFRRGRSHNLVITPDGPRGPRRKMAMGPIFLASKLGMPIVPMGFAYDRHWRTSTWDRFAIPHPGTTVRVKIGQEIRIATNLDRDGLDDARRRVEASLNAVTETAEAWASRQFRPTDAVKLRREVRFPSDANHSPVARLAA